MGSIKTTFIKHVARDLLEKYPDKFSADFEKNKLAMEDVVEIKSKRMRNAIAGYISRIKSQGY